MSRFSCNSIIILNYWLSVHSVEIDKIQNARIINSTSIFQSNSSTCICQCMIYLSSSSLCCYVNSYINNNTCQVIISPSTSNPIITIDKTTTVYKANCFVYPSTTRPSATNYENLGIASPNLITSSIITTTIATAAAFSTTSVSTTTNTYTTPWWCPMCGRRWYWFDCK